MQVAVLLISAVLSAKHHTTFHMPIPTTNQMNMKMRDPYSHAHSRTYRPFPPPPAMLLLRPTGPLLLLIAAAPATAADAKATVAVAAVVDA